MLIAFSITILSIIFCYSQKNSNCPAKLTDAPLSARSFASSSEDT